MKVFIAESSYPADFYNKTLDGLTVRNLLNTLRVENELRYVLDRKHFAKAIRDAATGKYDVFHLSCHGDDDGIALSDNTQPSWEEFAALFQIAQRPPRVLVMSTCCGASSGIHKAFSNQRMRPKIIFGSTKSLGYAKYCVAWAILYHRFKLEGINRDAAMTAMRETTAVVDSSFMYRRWDGQRYLRYPHQGVTYAVEQT